MSHNVPNRNWSYPTAIKFGVGRIAELAEHCAGAGIKKPLFVTDKALATLPITADAVAVLSKAGLGSAVFSEVDPNPNEGNMAAGIAAYKAGGHDGVICFWPGHRRHGLTLKKYCIKIQFSVLELQHGCPFFCPPGRFAPGIAWCLACP